MNSGSELIPDLSSQVLKVQEPKPWASLDSLVRFLGG